MYIICGFYQQGYYLWILCLLMNFFRQCQPILHNTWHRVLKKMLKRFISIEGEFMPQGAGVSLIFFFISPQTLFVTYKSVQNFITVAMGESMWCRDSERFVLQQCLETVHSFCSHKEILEWAVSSNITEATLSVPILTPIRVQIIPKISTQ